MNFGKVSFGVVMEAVEEHFLHGSLRVCRILPSFSSAYAVKYIKELIIAYHKTRIMISVD